MFTKEKEARLIEKAKALREQNYNWSQISKTFGIPEEWFITRLIHPVEKKSTPKVRRGRRT